MAAVIHHPAYADYSFGDDHPFSPLRVRMLLDLLAELGHPVQAIAPEPATREDLLAVHADYYVDRVERLGAGKAVVDAQAYGLATPDTPAFLGMDEAARWQVGGTLLGANLIWEGKEKRVLQLGGGLHHAQRNAASGFCIYNDLAVAIQFLIRKGLWVAYLDIDVHHGDGVQQIFYDDKRVMTFSLHESGKFLFPGSGDPSELGSGAGLGLKLNLPLEPLTEGESYREVFEMLAPAALRQFRPGVLVVQAGADAHYQDQLADLLLTTQDYEAIFRRILELAETFTGGRVLFTLGGGYSLDAAPRVWAILALLLQGLPLPGKIPQAWRERWGTVLRGQVPSTLHDPDLHWKTNPQREAIRHRNHQSALRLLEAVAPYWT